MRLEDKNTFKDIESFIESLKMIPEIVGIVEYGGRTYSDMSKGGDYDLTVIFDKPVSNNFTGFHFHIGDIPVDCMVVSKEDFMADEPKDIFMLVHLNCTILYDKDNITLELLERIKDKWAREDGLSDSEVALYRFTFRHILDKLKYRLYDNEVYTKHFIFSSMDWFISCYANIKNWEVGKTKLHLKLIEKEEPVLYEIISKLYSESSLDKMYNLLEEIANYMLEDIGGMWMEDEVLFHLSSDGINDKCEQKKFLKNLKIDI